MPYESKIEETNIPALLLDLVNNVDMNFSTSIAAGFALVAVIKRAISSG
jgi:hypothetical protein